MILWNAELTKRLACTDKEKAALPALVQELLAVSDRVRAEGFKPLIESGDFAEPTMLHYGFRLIAEGFSVEVLEGILAIYLATSSLSGFEFLKQCVYAEALLSMAAGDSRELLLRKLAPYGGAEKAFSLLQALDPKNGESAL